jgi:hypothetical protein
MAREMQQNETAMPDNTSKSTAATIEQQLILLREFADEVLVCSEKCSQMDLNEIYARISKQVWLCDQLRHPEKNLSRPLTRSSFEEQLDSWVGEIGCELTESLGGMLAQLSVTEGQTQNVHRVQKVLADGTRRTLNILTNAVAMLSMVYLPHTTNHEQSASQVHRTAKA